MGRGSRGTGTRGRWPDRRRRVVSERADGATTHPSRVRPSGEDALRAALHRLRRHRDGPPLRLRLAAALTDRCSAEDLRALCFLLGTDYELLNGPGKSAKARELVLCEGSAGPVAEGRDVPLQRPVDALHRGLTLQHGRLRLHGSFVYDLYTKINGLRRRRAR